MSSSSTNATNADNLPVLSKKPESWLGAPVVSVKQLTPDGIELLMAVAHQMKQLVVHGGGGDDRLKHKIMATIFFEASTRTSCSFQAAMQRLGGTCIHVDSKTSSNKKGESLEDTVRCLESYVDVSVLRHPKKGSLQKVVPYVRKPIINAGDGVGEHPTQALLDLYTMCDELNIDLNLTQSGSAAPTSGATQQNKPLTVCMVGDLCHGRTVHSLAQLLGICGLSNVTLKYWAPHESLNMPESVQDQVNENIVQKTVSHLPLAEACEGVDVLYVTRIQKERFPTEQDYENVKVRHCRWFLLYGTSANQDANCRIKMDCGTSFIIHSFIHSCTHTIHSCPTQPDPSTYLSSSLHLPFQSSYRIDADLMTKFSDMIVMHPLPRVDEIAKEVDRLPNAAYFRQMENGMYVRMAILALVMGKA